MEILEFLEDILIPLGVCVVLPVLIVWIVFRSAVISDRLRAQVLIKAIESNNCIDADKLAEAMQKPRKTPAEQQSMRLLRGCLFSLFGLCSLVYALVRLIIHEPEPGFFVAALVSLPIGISYLVVYFVNRKSGKA